MRKMRDPEWKKELRSVLRKTAGHDALFHAFLQDILTPKEYDEIACRWQIVKELAQGTQHRDVAEHLHASISKVTRGARALLDSRGGFSSLLPPARS